MRRTKEVGQNQISSRSIYMKFVASGGARADLPGTITGVIQTSTQYAVPVLNYDILYILEY